jgi:UDP-glucose:glycoprotein glucosyltransferase
MLTVDRPDGADASVKKVPESSDEAPQITPLHASVLGDLGYQASQAIVASETPLETLQLLCQDFPSQSSKIAAITVNDTLVDRFRQNARVIPAGENVFWLNGMMVPRDKVEAFDLLSIMRRERELIRSLRTLGVPHGQTVEYLTHVKIAEKIETGTLNRFDVRDHAEGGNVIIWMNDLERDSRYKQWPQGVRNVGIHVYPTDRSY